MDDPTGTLPPGSIELATELLAPVVKSAEDVWGALVGDKLSAWRVRNGLKTVKKLHEESARLGLTLNPHRIPDRFAFAWFDEAPKHDDDDIQALFARLMARAASEDGNVASDTRLIGLIGSLTPVDARVFISIYSDTVEPSPKRQYARPKRFLNGRWNYSILADALEVSAPGQGAKSLEFLVAQNLLFAEERPHSRPALRVPMRISDSFPLELRGEVDKLIRSLTSSVKIVEPTLMGRSLYEAVRP
jgi:hypothetical protein